MTTLKHAFNGQNLPALVLKIVRGRYPPIPPQYSNSLKELIAAMLQKDPDERPSIEETLALPMMQQRISQFIIKEQSLSKSNIKQVRLAIEEIIEVSIVNESASDEQKDSAWLENKQKELESLYQNLHPSKKLSVDTISRKSTEIAVVERQKMQEERKKNRKEFYAQQLLER
jgi:NIMA (never in mitosis gene a)-related kinase